MSRLSLSERVVEEVAAAEGVDPVKLEPPLHEVVDPDALDQLFESIPGGPDRAAGKVTFEYLEYEVTVTADRRVTVREIPARRE